MKRQVEEQAAGLRVFAVRILRGDIAVRSTEAEMWQLEWSGDGDEEPVVERSGDSLSFQQRGEAGNARRLNMRIALPGSVEVVELRTGNGTLEVEGLRAQLVGNTGNGDVTLRAAGGDIRLDTGNGKVRAADVSGLLHMRSGHGDLQLEAAGGEASLETSAGRIEVIAPQSLALSARSGHGDIHIGDGSVHVREAHSGAGSVVCAADLVEGEHRLSSGSGDVKVRAVRGTVELRTGAGRIQVSDAAGRLKAHTGHGDIAIQAASGDLDLNTSSGRVEVKVARDLRLHAHSGNGDIQLGEGSLQSVDARTGRGTVRCAADLAAGQHALSSGHGDIHVRSARGEVRLKTASGRVEVHALEGVLRAETGNGDVQLRSASGEAQLHTGNGRVEVGAPRSLALHAGTGHGDVSIGQGTVRSLHLETKMGRVRCIASPEPGHHELVSGHGDLGLHLPGDVRARLDAQTGFGQIQSDFALVRVGRSGSMSFNGARMVGSIGPGKPDAEIVLRTGRGKIEIRRNDDVPAHYQPAEPEMREDRPEWAAEPEADDMLEVLRALARGEITVEEADGLMEGSGSQTAA